MFASRRRNRLRPVRVLAVVTVALFAAAPARGDILDPPANDAFASATVIGAIPFSAADDLTHASSEEGEPACGTLPAKTVWYRATPGTRSDLRATLGTTPVASPFLGVYTGASPSVLSAVSECRTGSRTVTLEAGVTYHFQLALPVHASGPVSFSLTPATGLAGRVTDSNGEPIADVCIEAWAYEDDGFISGYGFALTGADGTYRIVDISAGTYIVWFYPCGDTYWVAEVFDNKYREEDADEVIVAVGAVTEGIDAQLERARTITGTLTVAGAPAKYSCLEGFDAVTGEQLGWGYSGEDGKYILGLRGNGHYKVRFGCEYGAYVLEWYDDVSDPKHATKIHVPSGGTVPGIDAELVRRPAPVNDAFANAAPVTGLPFSARVDLYSATKESGEPSPCSTTTSRTAWYKIVPDADGLIVVNTRGSQSTAVLGVYTGSDVVNLHTVACNHHSSLPRNQIGFRGKAGTEYYLQLGGAYQMQVSIDRAFGVVENLPLEAGTPCAVACPYWSNPGTETEAEREATCAESPTSPAGSWDDVTVTVPATVQTGPDTEGVPTELLFVAAPDIDHDAWICYASPQDGKRYVASGANTTSEMCDPGPIKCDEEITIPVEPGQEFVLRVYNWSDANADPMAAFGYKVART